MTDKIISKIFPTMREAKHTHWNLSLKGYLVKDKIIKVSNGYEIQYIDENKDEYDGFKEVME